MKRLTLEDIPLEVLESVYHKWINTTNRFEIDWTPCSLCIYLKVIKREQLLIVDKCKELCPLYETGDCRSNATLSKLHYHYKPEPTDETFFWTWERRRLDFLKRLKEVIDKKEKER